MAQFALLQALQENREHFKINGSGTKGPLSRLNCNHIHTTFQYHELDCASLLFVPSQSHVIFRIFALVPLGGTCRCVVGGHIFSPTSAFPADAV